MGFDKHLASSVRRATRADAADAVDVLRSSITLLCVEDHHNDPGILAQWLRNKTVEEFERWLHDPTNHVVVSLDAAAVCGVGLINRSGHIRLCYVHPRRLRFGVGRGLLYAMEAEGLHWRLPEIRLTSSATARAFYEKHGYLSDGEAVPGVVRGYPYRKRMSAAGPTHVLQQA
jgi:GNAT superfamily N-acetyltransferase